MIFGYNNFGYEGSVVSVEVDLRDGIPAVDLVGLADGAVKESRERMRSAIRNSGFEFPTKRVLISLSPCDLKKEGAGFDLPIALAVLKESENISVKRDFIVLGELELNGNVRPVRATYTALQTALKNGIEYAIIPDGSEAVPEGMKVARVRTLKDAVYVLENYAEYPEFFKEEKTMTTTEETKIEFGDIPENNLDSIEGHNGLKYAMAVAVAGGHHLLAYGHSGYGKTTVLRHMPELLPNLTEDEIPSVTRVHSIAGLMSNSEKMKKWRPFRMPHQTVSIEGMCGGGVSCRPGEISLAHNGVLFLDEAAEFKSSVLQIMRVPLENGYITLSRAGRSTTYPAKFQLIMATNPCPCGNFGSKDKVCLCSARSIEMYWRKFPRPLIDKIAIRIRCDGDDVCAKDVSLGELRQRIRMAYDRQLARQGKRNQDLSLGEISEMIKFSADADLVLKSQAESKGLSETAVATVKKLARTLADMYDEIESPVVSRECVEEALKLQDRVPDFI